MSTSTVVTPQSAPPAPVGGRGGAWSRPSAAPQPQAAVRVARRPGPVSRVLHALWRLVTRLVLTAAVLGFLVVALGPHVLGYRTATMLTGSMSPMINPGDVIVSTPKPAADVQVGDVISYYIPVEDHRVETHRIVKVTKDVNGRLAVVTKGDANAKADPWVATLEGDTVWQTRAVVPHAGTVIRVLREPFVQTYVFWGALVLLLVVALRRIWSPAPVLDHEVLDDLADELGSAAAAHAFARTFADLVDTRVLRIEQAVPSGDVEATVEAGLSLEVTAATIGALRLSERSRAVTDAVEAGRARRARRALRSLRRAAAPTSRALAHTLRDARATTPTAAAAASPAVRVEA